MGVGLDMLNDPEILPENHRRALLTAMDVLTDFFFGDIESLASAIPDRFENTYMAGFLPDRYVHRYTPLFARQFLMCMATVAWKLRSPGEHLLACVAEELALHALIEEAKRLLDEDGVPADFESFEDVAFEDLDFEMLFDPQWDGIEDYGNEQAPEMRFANLRFDEWFLPFRPDNPVHPYVEGRDDLKP
jgi:hypothetical protein